MLDGTSTAPMRAICPESGKTMDMAAPTSQNELAVPLERLRATPFDELIDHLVRSSALTRAEAVRVISEVVAFFHEPLENFVKRRHRELQADGLANVAIYAQIQGELRFVRLAAPMLTERQIRRLIYG